MINLIYASSAVDSFTENELLELLRKARENNHRLGITGMLLYRSGNFLQVLEGEEQVVDELFDVIKRDPRHCEVTVIGKRPVAERLFLDWRMGFANLDEWISENEAGFSDFLTRPFTPDEFVEDPSFAHLFLQTFRENVR